MATRRRWSGNAADLASALQPVVQSKGRSWIKYGEAQHTQGAKVDQASIAECHDILAILKQFQANLSFTKATIKAVVQTLLKLNAGEESWSVKADHLDDYSNTISLRVANLCRCVSQGELKRSSTPWVKQLPWRNAGGSTQPSSSSQVSGDMSNDGFIFGWDSSLMMAWRTPRQKIGKNNFNKEICDRLDYDLNGPETGPMVAIWPDGQAWRVSDISVGSLKLMKRPANNPDPLWTGKYCVSHHELKIVAKKERTPLLSLYERCNQAPGPSSNMAVCVD